MTLESLLMILVRWGHLLFGIGWIGMLYYFNFVQGGYFKAATPEALKDAKAKLAPSALWWFRWGAMFTFLTGLVLLHYVYGNGQLNGYIIVGATLATVMFLNVWLVIWPNQKIALGLVQGGDAAAAGAKAALASRHNVLFSGPMAFGMLAGPHFIGSAAGYGHPGLTLGGWLCRHRTLGRGGWPVAAGLRLVDWVGVSVAWQTLRAKECGKISQV